MPASFARMGATKAFSKEEAFFCVPHIANDNVLVLHFDDIRVCTGIVCIQRSNTLYNLVILGILGNDLRSHLATFGGFDVTQHQ